MNNYTYNIYVFVCECVYIYLYLYLPTYLIIFFKVGTDCCDTVVPFDHSLPDLLSVTTNKAIIFFLKQNKSF